VGVHSRQFTAKIVLIKKDTCLESKSVKDMQQCYFQLFHREWFDGAHIVVVVAPLIKRPKCSLQLGWDVSFTPLLMLVRLSQSSNRTSMDKITFQHSWKVTVGDDIRESRTLPCMKRIQVNPIAWPIPRRSREVIPFLGVSPFSLQRWGSVSTASSS